MMRTHLQQLCTTAAVRTWLPLVPGPELAMLRMPAPVCFSS
jgi:hypothetical protein